MRSHFNFNERAITAPLVFSATWRAAYPQASHLVTARLGFVLSEASGQRVRLERIEQRKDA